MKTKKEVQKQLESMIPNPITRNDWHQGYVAALKWVLEKAKGE